MQTRALLALATALLVLAPSLVLADADGDLDKAIAGKKRDEVVSALAAAATPGDAKAATTLLRVLPKMRELDVHKELLDAIKAMKDEAAVAKLAEQAHHASDWEIRYLLVEGLALQSNAAAGKAVLDALEDKDERVLVVAARGVRHFPSVDTVEHLIGRYEKAEKNVKEAALCRELNGALSALTGEGLSFSLEWRGWWMGHKDTWKGDKKGESGSGDEPKGLGKSGGGETVTRRLEQQRPADARTIERIAPDEVIVVKGRSDSVESVLKAIGVKHTLVEKEKFPDQKLDPKAVLILNCDGGKRPFADDQIARIREFVEKGGYLFTSDWELKHTIERAFPGSIAQGGVSSKNKDEDYKVDIRPMGDEARHPLLRDVFPATTWDAGSLAWEMDGLSYLIKVASPDVHVLIESRELGKRFKDTPAVAVTFQWQAGKAVKPKTATGGGKTPCTGTVLHVLSHFKHQKDKDSGDKFALQQLLLNFFLEKHAANRASQ